MRMAGVNVGAGATCRAQPVHNAVFDAQGCKVKTFQRAVLRGDVHSQSFTRGKPSLPSHVIGGLINVIFYMVGLVCQLHQHALRQTYVQVKLHHFAP